MRILLFAGLLFAALINVATAQTVNAGGLFNTIQPYVTEGASALVLIIVGYIATWIRAKFGIDIDAKNREALHSAIVTGINLGVANAGRVLAGTEVNVGSAIAADAINWVNRSVPDALKHFGITPDTLATMIKAKVPQVTGATAPLPAPFSK